MLQAVLGFFTKQKALMQAPEMNESGNWVSDKLKWCPTSFAALEEAEKKILSYVKKTFTAKFVEIPGSDELQQWKIRTLTMNEGDEKAGQSAPLVLLHGLGSAIGLWVLNLDALSTNRPLYAIDVLGFGRSSRPEFSNDALEVEEQFVKSIESWRKKMGLQKFILLGHSMGGFIATAYAMRHPEHIHHLILADPWGFPEVDNNTVKKKRFPLWAKVIFNVLKYFNPLSGLRAAGPWGPQLVEKMRPDLLQKFAAILKDPSDMGNYIYHCNAQVPSGETAFKTMSHKFGWAKLPMVPRIVMFQEDIPITFFYGAQSWMDSKTGNLVQQIRCHSEVAVKLIPDSGHHVNADQPDIFNSLVNEVCEEVDTHVHETQTFQFSQTEQKEEYIFNVTDVEQMPIVSSVT